MKTLVIIQYYDYVLLYGNGVSFAQQMDFDLMSEPEKIFSLPFREIVEYFISLFGPGNLL
jgi:hypothetical protein